MKMQFFAVLRTAAFGSQYEIVDCENISIGEQKYPATPVPAILKKSRRSIMFSITPSVIEKKVHLVQKHPLKTLCPANSPLLLEKRHEEVDLVGSWRA